MLFIIFARMLLYYRRIEVELIKLAILHVVMLSFFIIVGVFQSVRHVLHTVYAASQSLPTSRG